MGGEPYPTWATDKQIPISKEEVSFLGLSAAFTKRCFAPTGIVFHGRWKVRNSYVEGKPLF